MMTEKRTILGHISQLTRANVNAMLDRAEDPQKMIDQLIRDYTHSIVEAPRPRPRPRAALAASGRADALRATGNTVDADKFDNLAKVALGKQISFENEAKDAEPKIASQNEVVEKLKTGRRASPCSTRRARSAASRRRCAAKRPASPASPRSPRPPWTPSSKTWNPQEPTQK